MRDLNVGDTYVDGSLESSFKLVIMQDMEENCRIIHLKKM
jgi:hypothetical protein